ncbi:MAG TPA: DEAD/DEAH box helicase, partial [Thermoprotei archaeon]|nr:DEAD/DEAH box helicase [Thermoprotei archaeon]
MLIRNINIPQKVKDLLIFYGYKELYTPQIKAINAGLLNGKNIVVSAPTASGKTLIAELAIVKKVVEEERKAVYLTPLRALANEKYEDFKKYEKIGLKIALTTGDYDSSDPWLSDYDIIITTNEKMDSLIRHNAIWLKNIGIVVADEIHLINSLKRGPVLEMVLARLRKNIKNLQIIALSATIRNAKEIAKWLNADLVESKWRPVPLKEGVYYNGKIYFNDGSEKHLIKHYGGLEDLIVDSLRDNGQILVFTNTRQKSMSLAKRISLITMPFIKKLSSTLHEISNTILQLEKNRINILLSSLIENGVAFHHAGLSFKVRKIVEDNFKKNIIKVIVATPTLAAGVNLPARRVIIHSYRRYNMELGYFDMIPILEYKQMAGRAGRPRFDKMGEAILIARTLDEMDMLFSEYIMAHPEKITSKLVSERALRIHVLATIALEGKANIKKIIDIFSKTFYAYQFGIENIRRKIGEIMRFLEKKNFIVKKNEVISITNIGERISQLYIDPYSAAVMIDKIYLNDKISDIGYLFLVCDTPDMPKLYLRRKEREKYLEVIKEYIDELPLSEDTIYSLAPDDLDLILADFKTSLLLYDWINEKSDDYIIEKYSVGPGDIYNLTQ